MEAKSFMSEHQLRQRRAKLFNSCAEICGDLPVRHLIIVLSSMASEMAYDATSEKNAKHLLDCGIKFGKLIKTSKGDNYAKIPSQTN